MELELTHRSMKVGKMPRLIQAARAASLNFSICFPPLTCILPPPPLYTHSTKQYIHLLTRSQPHVSLSTKQPRLVANVRGFLESPPPSSTTSRLPPPSLLAVVVIYFQATIICQLYYPTPPPPDSRLRTLTLFRRPGIQTSRQPSLKQ